MSSNISYSFFSHNFVNSMQSKNHKGIPTTKQKTPTIAAPKTLIALSLNKYIWRKNDLSYGKLTSSQNNSKHIYKEWFV